MWLPAGCGREAAASREIYGFISRKVLDEKFDVMHIMHTEREVIDS
jgi:hypothetical protein